MGVDQQDDGHPPYPHLRAGMFATYVVGKQCTFDFQTCPLLWDHTTRQRNAAEVTGINLPIFSGSFVRKVLTQVPFFVANQSLAPQNAKASFISYEV